MRKAAGIVLVLLGVIGFAICGVVLLRLPLPIPGSLIQHFGIIGFHVNAVTGPLSSLALLVIGVLLLRHPNATQA